MSHRSRPTSKQNLEGPAFGRRASDRGFASPTGWFGRRVGDKQATVRHSLSFAAQVAAQITPTAPDQNGPAYASTRAVRAGLVKDFKA